MTFPVRSVFGEPGLAVHAHKHVDLWPQFGAGGRFHFTRNVTPTMRLGFPVSAVGISFLL